MSWIFNEMLTVYTFPDGDDGIPSTIATANNNHVKNKWKLLTEAVKAVDNITHFNITNCHFNFNEFDDYVFGRDFTFGEPLTYLNVTNCSKLNTWYLSRLLHIHKNNINSELSTIIVSGCVELNDIFFEDFGQLPLLHLDIRNCTKITDTGIQYLSKPNIQITHLDISGCNITDVGLQYIARMPLTYLDMSRCDKITDNGVWECFKLKSKLTHLNIQGCNNVTGYNNITDKRTLQVLGTMPLVELSIGSVESLSFPDNDDIIYLAYRLQQLKTLTIFGAGELSTIGVKALSTLTLTSLTLSGCTLVKDEALCHIGGEGCLLTYLDLSGCYRISDNGLVHFKQSNLHHLDLSGCSNITDQGLLGLQQCAIQHLNLSGCSNITDEGLSGIQQCPLQYLNLSECSNITDQGLLWIQQCPLQHLDLSACVSITDRGLEHFKNTRLTHLNLYRCDKVTKAGVKVVVNRSLRILTLSDYTMDCNWISERTTDEKHTQEWNPKLQLLTVESEDFVRTLQQAEDLPPQFVIKGISTVKTRI
jgi:uncharacterized protein YjbI with pentapeptide repeats